MKKNRIFSFLLALLLTVQVALPARASEVEDEAAGENTQMSQESTPGETGTESAPTEQIVYTIPTDISGDASVSNGSHSINAMTPVAQVTEFTPDAKAELIYELNTDTLVFAQDIDEKLFPASMTKVMTCLVALEEGNLDDMVPVTYSALENFDINGSAVGLIVGEELSLRDLLYCLMVASANDAAMVIAEYLCGSEEAFVEKMNAKAAELGCTGTHFVNEHGLHDENHYTTARDMARILMAALEYDAFREFYSTVYYKVPATELSEERELHSTNYLLMGSIVADYNDARVIGGKTGHTTPAGRCLITVSEANDMRLLCVVMGAGSVSEDESAYVSFSETKRMLNFGFGNFMTAQVLSPDQILSQFPVSEGESSVSCEVNASASTVLPIGSDISAIRYEYRLDNGTVSAPVSQGQALGVARVWYRNVCVAQEEIYAASAVAKAEPPVTSGKHVDAAAPLGEDSQLWHIILVVILVLLVLIVLMLVVSYIRAAIRRAKRRKRREAMRRKRAAQAGKAGSSQKRRR